MHKRFVNHCTIDLTLIPCGPILIKSGKEGADPTKPDMEFVETYHAGGRSIYLPGSSLKGALRAHAERIVRTIGSDQRPQPLDPPNWENQKDTSGPVIHSMSKVTPTSKKRKIRRRSIDGRRLRINCLGVWRSPVAFALKMPIPILKSLSPNERNATVLRSTESLVQ